jgi:hypothetical protein
LAFRQKITYTTFTFRAATTGFPTCLQDHFFTKATGKRNILLFSNKKPIYSFFVYRLLKLFPEAKFIHIVRDPRDNLYSHIKTFKATNTLFLAMRWLKYNQGIEEQKRKMPDKYFTLLYEDFVTSPEQKLKQVCDFLQVEYSDSMLINTFAEAIRTFKADPQKLEVAKLIHQNLMLPINISNIGKWEKGLSDDDRTIVESISGDFARIKYGYTIAKPKNTNVALAVKILKMRFLFFMWEIYTKQRFNYFQHNMHYYQKKKSRRLAKLTKK